MSGGNIQAIEFESDFPQIARYSFIDTQGDVYSGLISKDTFGHSFVLTKNGIDYPNGRRKLECSMMPDYMYIRELIEGIVNNE